MAAPRRSASSSATAVLPVPVAPVRTNGGGATGRTSVAPAEALVQLVQVHAHVRGATVRVAVREPGGEQVIYELVHLLARERVAGPYRGVAGERLGDAVPRLVLRRAAPVLLAEPVEHVAQEPG